MTFLETLPPIKRSRRADDRREAVRNRARLSSRRRSRAHLPEIEWKISLFSKLPVQKNSVPEGQRVGGNDPGFGRIIPPKTRSLARCLATSGVVPAHAFIRRMNSRRKEHHETVHPEAT